jgi:hypothetical protein
LVFSLQAGVVASGDVGHRENPDTGLSSWKAEHDAFSLELIQVVPDYVRAVYASRGLPPELIERVVEYCVFGTIVRNTSDQAISWRTADWHYVTADGKRHPIKPKSAWVQEWRKLGSAFRWTLLPDEQTYEPGDWGQGFLTLTLEPGQRFDLEYAWLSRDQRFEGRIENAYCAKPPAESR